jgi:hypothetical protein
VFRNPIKPSNKKDEGDVIQVDPIRGVCKVKTLSGQNLDGVLWGLPIGGASRAGDRVTPTLGDRVVVSYELGYAVIEYCLPRLQTSDNTFPLSIDTGAQIVDTGNYTADGVTSIGDQNKPKDMLSGDRILASIGGAMIGLLRGGSLLLRSSRLSEIFLSKWDDLVRIVSRNFEHFTDVSTDITKNFRGRIYRYIGYTNTFANSTIENYQYQQYYGDTAAAEYIKSNYQNASVGSVPAINTIIFKEQVANSSGTEVMHRTLDLTGNQEILVTGGGALTRIVQTGAQITLSFNDQNTVTINTSEIDLKHNSGAEVTCDANGVRGIFGSGELNLSSSGSKLSFGSHFVNVDSGGVHLG